MPRGKEIYENPGGWPPERVHQVGVPPVLERMCSPVEWEDQRVVKKGKNCTLDELALGVSGELNDMDTENNTVLSVDGLVNAGDKMPPLVEQGTGLYTASYASVTAKGSMVDEGHGTEDYLDPDAVVALDEDCIIENSKKFPTIKFSEQENCKMAKMATESNGSPVDGIPIAALNEGSHPSDLYGPWMVVANRKRRVASTVGKDQARASGSGSGSRFTALQVDELAGNSDEIQDNASAMEHDAGMSGLDAGNGVVSPTMAVEQHPQSSKNAAYMESNPARKNK
ncbi:hypothetical protein V6N13_060280 [Hibiscus sabdariffa]